MAARVFHDLLLLVLLVVFASSAVVQAQQTYVDNRQLDCDNKNFDNQTKGYICNGPPSCRSYVTFRSEPPYNTAEAISRLLNSSADEIRSINELSSVNAVITTRELVIVPVICSCSRFYYQHNASYRLRIGGETYFSVANDTYQALSTCQAMMSQNPYGERNLSLGLNLLVPLRCACPTGNQTAAGFKYLVTYLVAQGDTVAAIADSFGSNESSVKQANELDSDMIYFFTPILVPITSEPTKIKPPPQSSPPPPPPSQPPPSGSSESSKKGIYIGVGVGAGLLLTLLLSFILFCYCRRRRREVQKPQDPSNTKNISDSSPFYSAQTKDSKSWSTSNTSSQALTMKSAIESLTLYRFEDLQDATSNFSESNKIKGSVYRGSFNGDYAAVKVIKGEVSSEINLLKKINHSNVIRLSGFCIRQGNTYLVYEYAENGSVSDWIHSNKTRLTWKQRVQIACDVADALNYLHNYTSPTYIHKNLKSSNVLVDANFRAKVGNFGLARSLNDEQDSDFQLTRHVIGTQGYLAPEYIENGLITPKLDVFAFGVVILELLSGKEPATAEKNEEEGELLYAAINRVLEGDNVGEKLKSFMDPCLENEYPPDLAFSMAQLAKSCVARDLNARPSVSDVLTTLSMILSSTLEWEPYDANQRMGSLGSSG